MTQYVKSGKGGFFWLYETTAIFVETFSNGSDSIKTIYMWLFLHSQYISTNVILYQINEITNFFRGKKSSLLAMSFTRG
jgi:hypothetical protein